MPPNPPSKRLATPRVASPPPPPPKKKIVAPPLENPAYAYELLLKNLFENPPWKTVLCTSTDVCNTLYIYALQNLLGGKK